MIKAAITWTRPALTKYLSSPAKLAPGSRMVIGPLKPEEQIDIVAYLARVDQKP
jgi:cytochrome c2